MHTDGDQPDGRGAGDGPAEVAALAEYVQQGVSMAIDEGLPDFEGLQSKVLRGCFERLGHGTTARTWRSTVSGDVINFAIRRVQWKELAWVVACEEPDPRNTPSAGHNDVQVGTSLDRRLEASHAALNAYLGLHGPRILTFLRKRGNLQYSYEDRYQSSVADFYHAYLRSSSSSRFGALGSMWRFIGKQAVRVDDPRMERSGRNPALKRSALGGGDPRGLQSLSSEFVELLEAGQAHPDVVAGRLESEEMRDLLVDVLPERLGIVLVMMFIEGMKQNEIARALEITPSAVNQRKAKAVSVLAQSKRFLKGMGIQA